MSIVNNFKNIFSRHRQNPEGDTIVMDLQRQLQILKYENSSLRRSQRRTIPVIDPAIADPVPTDTEARKEYVSTFCGLYNDFLEKKLIHLIAQIREDMDWSGWEDYGHPSALPNGMTRNEYDAFLRGTSNAFRMLMEYGRQMQNENLELENK